MFEMLKQFGGENLISGIAEKVGVPTDQVSSIMDNAMPMITNLVQNNGLSADLLSGDNLSNITSAVSEKTGISPDVINNVLGGIAPQLSNLLGEGKAGGLMDMVSGFLDKNKDGNLLDDVMGMFK